MDSVTCLQVSVEQRMLQYQGIVFLGSGEICRARKERNSELSTRPEKNRCDETACEKQEGIP
jgi:hypothetical protein